MRRDSTQRNTVPGPKRSATFVAVRNSNKQKVKGLWRRGKKYYAQLRMGLGNGRTAPRRIPLEATNLEEAKAEIEKKRTENRQGKLPRPGLKPRFDDFAEQYLASGTASTKKLGTQQNEKQAIKRWKAHMGGVRLDRITPAVIHGFREARLKGGASARTVNLDVIALRSVLKFAKDDGKIDYVVKVDRLKESPPVKQQFLAREQFKQFLDAITPATTKNASLFRLYIQFLALTGAREQEALRVSWNDVDFVNDQVTIGRGGVAKNKDERAVDFSPELKVLLAAMDSAKPPDSSWLFPSPQRGKKDIHASSLRDSLNAVREAAGMPWVGFHDFRHFFAALCVMAGIDHMTTSKWLGHKDGGKLVGEVYGHVADEHKKRAAQKLSFLPAITK
jgi:integrase